MQSLNTNRYLKVLKKDIKSLQKKIKKNHLDLKRLRRERDYRVADYYLKSYYRDNYIIKELIDNESSLSNQLNIKMCDAIETI